MKLSDMTKEEFDEYMKRTWLFEPITAENVYLVKKDLRESGLMILMRSF